MTTKTITGIKREFIKLIRGYDNYPIADGKLVIKNNPRTKNWYLFYESPLFGATIAVWIDHNQTIFSRRLHEELFPDPRRTEIPRLYLELRTLFDWIDKHTDSETKVYGSKSADRFVKVG